MTDLKPCPFCGRAPKSFVSVTPLEITPNRFEWVYCGNPDCWLQDRKTTPERWNARPIDRLEEMAEDNVFSVALNKRPGEEWLCCAGAQGIHYCAYSSNPAAAIEATYKEWKEHHDIHA